MPRPQRTRRRAFGLAGAVCGLAAVVGVVSLAGGGPLAPAGGDSAKAKPGCHVVYVVKVAPVGEVVRRGDGTVEVETSTKPVSHAVQRCR